jgi:transcriptional regulator with XRE-family HTH domain
MDKREIVEGLTARRDALGLTYAQLAERSGLTERSVRNALGPVANPQLSSLLALLDALDLEFHLAPRGYGPPSDAGDATYRPVATRVGEALAPSAVGPARAPRSTP